ncbi:MAG TPA: hypothetical protein ENN84_11230 [Candidatus Marinimicrobia bacterium]|nr:hypothetical protein [Candidatus Neomarinimicrobiota bacterium]
MEDSEISLQHLEWFKKYEPNPIELLQQSRNPRIRFDLAKTVLHLDPLSNEYSIHKRKLIESKERRRLLYTLEKLESQYRSHPPRKKEEIIQALQTVTSILAEAWDFGCHKRMNAVRDSVIFVLKHQQENSLFPGPLYLSVYIIETLCRYDFEGNRFLEKAIRSLIRMQNEDGGWGTADEHSDIWLTLKVLSACSNHSVMRKRQKVLTGAEFILNHIMDENKGGILAGKQVWDFLEYGYDEIKSYRGGTLRVLEILTRFDYTRSDKRIMKMLRWLDEVRLKNGYWPGVARISQEASEAVTLRTVRTLLIFFGNQKAVKSFKIINTSKFLNDSDDKQTDDFPFEELEEDNER